MGRPKGSLNKKNKKPLVKMRRKRGRPRTIKKAVEEVLPPSNVKKFKFAGYCPKCNFIIGKQDLESKQVFVCPACGKRGRISTLKKDKKKQVMTKKEYLESSVNVDFHDMPSMNGEDHGELKIIT